MHLQYVMVMGHGTSSGCKAASIEGGPLATITAMPRVLATGMIFIEYVVHNVFTGIYEYVQYTRNNQGRL